MIVEQLADKLRTDLNLSSVLNSEGNVSMPERILSLIGGTFIIYKGLKQFRKHPLLAVQEAMVGSVLLYRAATGICPVYSSLEEKGETGGISLSESFIVERPREEVYAFWRKLENLPRFMKHLASVEQEGRKRSRWKAYIPGEIVKLSWNAEIIKEEENAYLGWKSVEGSMVDNAGTIQFRDALNGGTELSVDLAYFPPAGSLGQGIAKLLNGIFKKMLREDITNFMHYVEGEEYKSYEHGPAVRVAPSENSFR